MFLTKATVRPDPRDVPEAYPYSVPAIKHLQAIEFPTPVTFFVGEKGSGKSTLPEAIAAAVGLNPEAGTKHVRFTARADRLLLPPR